MCHESAAALALRGNGALLNFPKLAHSLPRLADLSDKSIQAAATIAANSFAQRSSDSTTAPYNNFDSISSSSSPKADTDPRQQQTSSRASSQRLSSNPNGSKTGSSSKRRDNFDTSTPHRSSFTTSTRRNSSSEDHGDHHNNRLSYNVIDSSGRSESVENLQHQGPIGGENLRENVAAGAGYNITVNPHPQPMYIDSEDMFTIGPVGLTNLYDAMCIPPPDPDHTTETDGEEGSNSTWEPHLWSY